MIYFDWLCLIAGLWAAFESVYWMFKEKESKVYLLYLATALVFLDFSFDVAKDIKSYYEEQPAVKEVIV